MMSSGPDSHPTDGDAGDDSDKLVVDANVFGSLLLLGIFAIIASCQIGSGIAAALSAAEVFVVLLVWLVRARQQSEKRGEFDRLVLSFLLALFLVCAGLVLAATIFVFAVCSGSGGQKKAAWRCVRQASACPPSPGSACDRSRVASFRA
jgi:hypothetical protein